ncbi:AraC family transcriptional regulator [Rhodopseudomonas telluris]|uniref:Helix-turn-helix transcriptional regulator n=1 Tax=Rhodopseudomonas telluris TaxID=644215 RepID=A0ABV6EWZ8_9BRAD
MSDASERPTEANYPANRAPAAPAADAQDMRYALIGFDGAQAFSGEAEGFECLVSVVELDVVTFGFCRSRTPTAATDLAETDFARLQVALRGNLRSGDERIIIRCPNGALMATLESMLRVKPRGKLVFAPSAPIDDRGAQAVYDFAMLLARHVDASQPRLPPLMLREFERALLVSLLSVARHNFSDQLDRDAPDSAPDYVRVAEEFIASSWNRAITINDLAAVTSVGVRSLFKAFQKHRGYSPMAFAKSVRLNKARELLLQGEPSRSVTSVAFACGFSNLGHFAHDYRQKHGELPSETLARAR